MGVRRGRYTFLSDNPGPPRHHINVGHKKLLPSSCPRDRFPPRPGPGVTESKLSPFGAPVYCRADGDVAVMAPPPPRVASKPQRRPWCRAAGDIWLSHPCISGHQPLASTTAAHPTRAPPLPLASPFLTLLSRIPWYGGLPSVQGVWPVLAWVRARGASTRTSLWRGLGRPRYAARRTEEPICHAVLSRVVTFCGEP